MNVKTLVITCADTDRIPSWTIRRCLGAYTVVRCPSKVFTAGNSGNFALLGKYLQDYPGVHHVVVCLDSLCQQFSGGSTQEVWLSETMQRLRIWLRSVNRPDVEVHGWVYEPETDWITALDTESDLLVPLNAHTRFYERQLMVNPNTA